MPCWIVSDGSVEMPRFGSPVSDLAEGLYSYPQQSHVVYFRVLIDASSVIEIVRVLHGRMEPARHVG
jgi:plasmid stabilization system protein ParE